MRDDTSRLQLDRWLQQIQEWLLPRMMRRRILSAAFVSIGAAALYWGVLASDRFVSEAHVVINRTDLAGHQSVDFGALFSGAGSSKQDIMLLRDHLLSMDMLQKLDAQLDLRGHFSDTQHDVLSRLWSRDIEVERFHKYFRTRVEIEFDDYADLLVIRTQAYSPVMAQRICAALVAEGERFMNQMGHSLALEQVTFLEKQAESMGARVAKTRQALLDYQNVKRLASPKASIEGAGAIIARLEGEISQLSARREAMLGYLSPTSSDVVQIDLQISALKKQLSLTQQRMTSVQGEALNRINEEYQRLEMEAAFAQEVYQQALTALEKGRIESVRTLKKISVVQSPTLPQQSLEPQRLYNTVIFTLATLMLAGIVHLLAAIIRDHKD